MPWVTYVLFETIYGIAGFALSVYFLVKMLSYLLRKRLPAEMIAAIVFVFSILTFPSIERYQFEKRAVEMLRAEGYEPLEYQRGGELSQPLTLIWPPVVAVRAIANDPIRDGVVYEAILAEDTTDPLISILDVDCGRAVFLRSVPDEEGVFRTLPGEHELTEVESERFCS